jgi:hypothetical protein
VGWWCFGWQAGLQAAEPRYLPSATRQLLLKLLH